MTDRPTITKEDAVAQTLLKKHGFDKLADGFRSLPKLCQKALAMWFPRLKAFAAEYDKERNDKNTLLMGLPRPGANGTVYMLINSRDEYTFFPDGTIKFTHDFIGLDD